jgi:hypothetical protein
VGDLDRHYPALETDEDRLPSKAGWLRGELLKTREAHGC